MKKITEICKEINNLSVLIDELDNFVLKGWTTYKGENIHSLIRQLICERHTLKNDLINEIKNSNNF